MGQLTFGGKIIEKGSQSSMSTSNQNYSVLELRVAFTVNNFERSVRFYCDGLGIEPAALWINDGGQALILNMGNATLEIFDESRRKSSTSLKRKNGSAAGSALRCRFQIYRRRWSAC
jgi:hypothetical protein